MKCTYKSLSNTTYKPSSNTILKGQQPSSTHDSLGEESLRINEYYQPPPRRNRRDRREQESPREVRVDLPHFHGKENVEVYLDWEMKVEQFFACHRVSEERKVPLATLSFQGNTMYWWTSLERDRRLHREPQGRCRAGQRPVGQLS